MTIEKVNDLCVNSCRYIICDKFCEHERFNNNVLFCEEHYNMLNNKISIIRSIQYSNGYMIDINNMKNGSNIHKYLYTGDKTYLNNIDYRYNIVILEKLYYLLKLSGFRKYEIGNETIPDMIIKFNNKQMPLIPLEINTSVNKIKLNEEQIKNHINENKYCYLLSITPKNLLKFDETNNIGFLLNAYY